MLRSASGCARGSQPVGRAVRACKRCRQVWLDCLTSARARGPGDRSSLRARKGRTLAKAASPGQDF
ncbi:MAG: hypothetical protein PHW87_13730 [Methanothrix sp.]|nr:hypothetical protein [Methanothrix sp.]